MKSQHIDHSKKVTNHCLSRMRKEEVVPVIQAESETGKDYGPKLF